jgi:hypothetical protein
MHGERIKTSSYVLRNKKQISVEMPTRCSFVIEFIIPKFLVPTQPWQRPVTIWAYKPGAANTVYSS